jgi:RNA polymerase sigma factor (sigma-70 family)
LSELVNDRQKKVLDLLDTSGPRLHALLARLTLSQDVVGDLMQELFIKLAGSSGFGRADDPFAYAYRTAINLAFDWRRKKKLKFQPLDENSLPTENNPSPLAEMVQTEALTEVLDMMTRLNDLAREVIVMHYIEQEPYEQIAQRLGKKPQHIRSISAKALTKLRQLLKGC